MLQDIIVMDNFFKDPDSIVEFANKQAFEKNDFEKTKSYWMGSRTNDINISKDPRGYEISKEFFNNIFVNEYNLTSQWNVSTYFHRLGSLEKFNYKWIHVDGCECVYAGVVYLSKNPSENSGTFIIKKNEIIPIENIYNRLVLYKSDYLHSSMGGFGEGENSRLTLTIFINAISINLRKNND